MTSTWERQVAVGSPQSDARFNAALRSREAVTGDSLRHRSHRGMASDRSGLFNFSRKIAFTAAMRLFIVPPSRSSFE
jgi:hypothetical protein